MASIISLFCSYPLWAGERAVSKVQRSSKFIPTIAEIEPVLEDLVRLPKYAAQYDREAQEQLLQIAGPVTPKPSYDELKAKYGENWGITNPDKAAKPPISRPLEDLAAECGVSRAQLDAIPDAKDYHWDKIRPNFSKPRAEAAE